MKAPLLVLFVALLLLACSDRSFTASVILANETDVVLTDIHIREPETNETIVVERLEPGDRERVRIRVRGEGAYSMRVVLPGAGEVIEERYVETGYTVVEHIGSDTIEPEYAHY